MKNIHRLLLFSALTLGSIMTPSTHAVEGMTPQTFDWQVTRHGQLQYLLSLPPGYDAKAAKRWPLLLFLHGAGERGTNVWQVAVHGPPKLARQGTNFPFLVVSPQCPSGESWQPEALLQLLDDVVAHQAVDTNRIYLTGLSMGGYGTWNLGLMHPERFAAIAPICGGGNLIDALVAGRQKADALKTLPVWVFHGAKDPVVPLEESVRMVNVLRKIGCAEVKFTVYPEAQHDSWSETYANPEFFEWLLAHERGRQPVISATKAPPAGTVQALLDADTAFARLAANHGIAEAFFAFAAEDAVELPMDKPPVKGRAAIRQAMTSLTGSTLQWTPVAADLARSDDLGYTWGTYEYRPPAGAETTNAEHGKYVTIWKKQADGTWKIVLDIGNAGPAPK